MAQMSTYNVDNPSVLLHQEENRSTSPPPPASDSLPNGRPPRPSLVTTSFPDESSIPHQAQAESLQPDPSHPTDPESDPQSDPDSFYRRYKDSFRGRSPSGIYLLNSPTDAPASDATTAGLPRRASNLERRPVGANSNKSSVAVRMSSLAEKYGQDAANVKREPVLPRGRQASVKAFVSRFEQRPDEIISTPDSKPGSRSTSAHRSPSTTFNPRSFRSRTPSRTPVDDRPGFFRRQSGNETIPEVPPPLTVSKRTTRRDSAETRFDSNNSTSNSTSGRLEPSEMKPSSNSDAQKPLFGEIVAGQADLGWGIADSTRPRSGSEAVAARPNSLFRDDTQLEMSPTSPTNWYRQPTFEGFDSSRMPQQPQPATQAVQQHDNSTAVQDVTGRPPASPSDSDEQRPTPPPKQPGYIPKLSRRISYANDSDPAKIMSSLLESASATEPPAATSQASTSNSGVSLSHSRHTMLTLDTTPKLSASSGAISPPAKSPPLRNSRNRPSLATANAASSKVLDRSKTVGSGSSPTRKQVRKNLPELGTVDFAARRERIQRAFSKSVEEKEAEQRRSLILEAHRRKHEKDDIPPVPPVPPVRKSIPAENSDQAGGEERPEHPRKDSETLVTVFPNTQDAPNFDISSFLPPPPPIPRRESSGDSPTLGSTSFFATRPQVSTTPSEAGSSDSYSNYFDNRNKHAAQPHTGMSAELDPHPQPESIHIVLGDASPPKPRPGASDAHQESRWSMSSWASSTDSTYRYSANEPSDGRLESINEDHDGNEHSHAMDSRNNTVRGHSENRLSAQSFGDDAEGDPKADSPLIPNPMLSNEWMVDHRIVPPRSFAQDASPSVQTSASEDAGSLLSITTTGADSRRVDVPRQRASLAVAEPRRDRLSPSSPFDTPATKYSQRASLMSAADFAAASPSIGDWIAVQAQDTPTDEISPHSFSDRQVPPPPKKVTGLRPRTPKKTTDGLLLPEIHPTEGGLGIDINVDTPPTFNLTKAHNNTPDALTQARAQIEDHRRSLTAPSDVSATNSAGNSASRPRSSRSQSTLNSEEPKAGSSETRNTSYEHSIPPVPKPAADSEQKAKDAEQKRLTRRKNIIKELVDTESSFGQDMTVVVDIYKETSHVILQNADDVRILFGNAMEVVTFSTNFLDSLKAAASSVYRLPPSKRWRTKRDSSATAESSQGDDASSINNLDLSDDERDRLTSVGTAFQHNLGQMEKVYTDYLKNHEAASSKLVELQKSDKVQIWLNECRAYAHDLTTAWSLDSLLVKPVQRILKYPLLLKELADVTPENHPDFTALDSMCREIVGVSKRINAAKKRADLVEQAHSVKKEKRPKKEERRTIAKAFGRNKEKIKQQVGLSDIVQDKTYNILADKFGSHFFQVQVVMRDIEMYTVDVQGSVKRFDSFISAIEEHMDVAQSPYPEIESKWRIFRQASRELQLMALTDHVNSVRDHVIQPMKSLLKYYEGPQRMMEKRKKRVLDHARWKQLQDAGGKVDKKLIEQGEQFVAINETLKEELPQLFAKTKKLVEHCLNIFVQLQLQWQTIWRRKLSQVIDARQMPKIPQDIVDSFNGDFKYTEAQVQSLAICSGALKDDDSLSLNSGTAVNSSTTTLNGEDVSRQTSLTYSDIRDHRRSSQSRHRAASANSQGPYQSSSYYPAAYAQGPPSRDRTSSNVSGRRAERPQWGSQGGSQGNIGFMSPPQSANSTGRPPSQSQSQSQSQRGNSALFNANPYDPSSYSRYSDDSSRQGHWYSSMSSMRASSGRPSDSQYGLGAALVGATGAAGAAANPRGSQIFSSALPPSETTPPPSAPLSHSLSHTQSRYDPNADHDRYQPTYDQRPQYNVLFLAASVYEFNIDRARREAGYPYLTYAAGEIFDVIGEKGELWLAKNQDDSSNTLGWIWNKHFAKLAGDR